ALAARPNGVRIGRYVAVTDPASLELACRCAGTDDWTVLDFRDPTKIPLEIVLAAATGAEGNIVTVARDVTDAELLFGVLERGSDGVLMAPAAVGDATRLKAAAVPGAEQLKLTELTVTGTRHVGMGERACVDTCTYLRKDEGILIGSQARGMLLCASETHPLPYMPTRPFRVNAGAIMSYTLTAGGHTRYLSELCAGSTALAVDVHGHARIVTVGRIKIESRPLLCVDAVAPDGRTVNAIVQDDWHVRVLGPACAGSGGRLVPFYFANPYAGPRPYRRQAPLFRGLELSPAVYGTGFRDATTYALVRVAADAGHPVYTVCTGQRGARAADLVWLA